MPDLIPSGGEIRVNPVVEGSQFGALVIGLTGGNYAVFWYDLIGFEEPTYILKGQVFSAEGTQVGDIILGSVQDPFREAAFGVTALESGGFAVIYAPVESGQFRIQRFNEVGESEGLPIAVPESVPLDTPSLTADGNGGFFAVYASSRMSGQGLVAVRFGADGTAIGAPFDVATNFLQPTATVLANGDLLVAWEDADQTEPGTNIHARIFSPAGSPRGPIILVDAVAPLARSNAAVTAFDDGRFAVTWTNGTTDTVLVRLFSATGVPLGEAVQVDPEFVGEESAAQVIDTQDGGFLVTYVAEGKDGSELGLFARPFGADGQPVGPARQIAQTTEGSQSSGIHNVTILADGSLIFGWFGNGDQPGQQDDLGVFIRRFELVSGTTQPTAGNDRLDGTGGDDRYFLQQGGDDRVSGGTGSDGFYFGSAFTPADRADGGIGIDSLALQGDYADLTLGSVSNIEVLVLLSGSDTRFGDAAGNRYDYVVSTSDAIVAASAILTVQADTLLESEDLIFDGSAETDGSFRIFAGRGNDDLTGGAGNDGFLFGNGGHLNGNDRIDGGGGTDSVALRGNYVAGQAVNFNPSSLNSIEVLVFLSGLTREFGGAIVPGGFDYDVTMSDGNLAAGARMDVVGNLSEGESLRFDGRAETEGSFRITLGAGEDIVFGSQGADTIEAGRGADRLDGSGGADLYVYRSAADSIGASADSLTLGAGDRIDLSLLDADADAANGDQAFMFIGSESFTNVAGQLRALEANGGWIVQADLNGDGVADFVIDVVTPLTITADTFIL